MSKTQTPLLINCDMGEWDAPHLHPSDKTIMPLIDMSNIACGGHAGTKEIIQTTIDIAKVNNVKIGAHPGYEDRARFGRSYIPFHQDKLTHSITKQLDLFLSICKTKNVKMHHVKAHGALYHACNHNDKEADVFIEVIKKLCPDVIILVAPNSKLEKLARQEGIKTMSESFIDRKYNDDLSLVLRKEPGAVIENVNAAKSQYEYLTSGKILTKSGSILTLNSETACIHGDNPMCVQILQSIRSHE